MKLKPSERRLLIVFVSLFTVIVGGFGTTFLVGHFAAAADELHALAARRDHMVSTLAESEHWRQKSRWIDAHLPAFPSREGASTYLLDAVSEKAGEAGVQIKKKELLTDPDSATAPRGLGSFAEPDDVGGPIYFDRVAVILNVEGSEEALVRWLHGIALPEAFLGVTHLTYSKGETGVRCTVQVSLWFRESDAPNLAVSP